MKLKSPTTRAGSRKRLSGYAVARSYVGRGRPPAGVQPSPTTGPLSVLDGDGSWRQRRESPLDKRGWEISEPEPGSRWGVPSGLPWPHSHLGALGFEPFRRDGLASPALSRRVPPPRVRCLVRGRR